MRKKIKVKINAPKKVRATTFIEQETWDSIQLEAVKNMSNESQIMRLLICEALSARALSSINQ